MNVVRLPLRLRCFFGLVAALALFSAVARAANPLDAVRAADTARIQAIIAGDLARLAPLLSDDLLYGHADGGAQTKAQFLTAVGTSRMKYEAYDYGDTKLTEVAPGVVTMTGTASLRGVRVAERVAFALRFLAVWREEGGKWQLVAYQSTRVAEPAAPTPTAPPK